MITYVSGCVDCGLPCLGESCPNERIPILTCDDCGEEADELYEDEGEEVCEDCLKKRRRIEIL